MHFFKSSGLGLTERSPKRYVEGSDAQKKYLYSDEAQMQSLSQIIVIAYENGPAFAKMMLKALKPDKTEATALNLWL